MKKIFFIVTTLLFATSCAVKKPVIVPIDQNISQASDVAIAAGIEANRPSGTKEPEVAQAKSADELNAAISKTIIDSPARFFDQTAGWDLVDVSPRLGYERIYTAAGDLEGLKAEDIQNAVFTFKGNAIVRGFYQYGGSYYADKVCFYEENGVASSALPRLLTVDDDNANEFCFDNGGFALSELGLSAATSTTVRGAADVEIGNYKKIVGPASTLQSTAALKRVVRHPDDLVEFEEFSFNKRGLDIRVERRGIDFSDIHLTPGWLQDDAYGCGQERAEGYYQDLLAAYDSQKAVQYVFTFARPLSGDPAEPGEVGRWEVTVLPNRLGHTDLERFQADFNICEVGGDRYPKQITDNYLLFVSTACGGADFYPDTPRCFDLNGALYSGIKLK